MPPRHRRPYALALAGLIVAGGCASPDPVTVSPPTATSTGGSTAATAPPASAAKPTCPTVNLEAKPAVTWKNALSALDSARTSTYRLVTETLYRDGHQTTSRSIKVDEQRKLAEYSASVGAKAVSEESSTTEQVTIVVDGKQAYVTLSSWSGPRAGKWMRLEAAAAESGVPMTIPAVDTVPSEIIDFVPRLVEEEYGRILVHGTVPAATALSALGLNALLSRDTGVAASLSGQLDATARLDNNGCLEYVGFYGQRAGIKGGTKKTPARELAAVIRASSGRLFISSVNSPQTITVPRVDSIVDSAPI